MHRAVNWPTSLGLLAIASAILAAGDDAAEVRITPTTPAIEVGVRANESTPYVLPDLQFEFEVTASCADGGQPRSLMLSIADSRTNLRVPDLGAAMPTVVSMTVPSKQIAPLNVHGFCMTGDDQPGAREPTVTVPGILSAQASLLCAATVDDTGAAPAAPDRISYFSTALDIMLVCLDDEAAGGEPQPRQ